MQAKKILILNHNNENYGTYFRCFFIGKYLGRLGYKITMLCASGKNFDLSLRRKKIEANFTIYTLPRIKYHKYFTGQMFLRFPFYLIFSLFGSYDIIYAFTVAQPQIGLSTLAAKLFGKTVLVDWDDLWGRGFADKHSFPIKQILYFFERFIPQKADWLTVASRFIKKEALACGYPKNKISRIPNGANIEEIKVFDKIKSRQELGLMPDKKFILSMGNTYTSLEILFRAFYLVLKNNSRCRLIMLGQVELKADLKNKFRKLLPFIIFPGSRPFKEVPKYMSVSDVLVLPMDDNNIEKARFPMRLGDYLCAARPIVSNAVGEVYYYLKKYRAGLIVPPTNWQALAENITQVLNNNILEKELIQNANFLAKKLAWPKVAEKLNKILIKL